MSRDLPRGDRDDVEDEPFKDPPNCPTCAERDSPVLTVFTRNRGSRESRQVLTQATTVA